MHFAIDGTWERTGPVVVAGSPLKIFRLTAPGARIAEQIERGADVASSTLIDRLVDAGAIHPESHPGATSVFTVDDVTVITPQLGGIASTDGRVVVDDSSTPPIAGATIRLDNNSGPGAARNAGRPLATTALLAFVDADVDLLGDVGIGSWLMPLLPHFNDPSVALIAPRVAGEPGSPLDLGDKPGRIRAGTRLGYVPAAAIVVRADAFDAVGGFDPALRFGEDVDFVWRLDQAGWRCRYEPASAVWHEPRSNWPDRLHQQVGYGSAAAPLALRHPNALAPMHTNGWAVGSWPWCCRCHGCCERCGACPQAAQCLDGVVAPNSTQQPPPRPSATQCRAPAGVVAAARPPDVLLQADAARCIRCSCARRRCDADRCCLRVGGVVRNDPTPHVASPETEVRFMAPTFGCSLIATHELAEQ